MVKEIAKIENSQGDVIARCFEISDKKYEITTGEGEEKIHLVGYNPSKLTEAWIRNNVQDFLESVNHEDMDSKLNINMCN